MSVTVREYKNDGWMVDVRTRLADGLWYRERRRMTVTSKSAAHRWGQDRERHLLQHGRPQPKKEPEKEVPTLGEFKDRFLDDHVHAERLKPSGVTAKESIINVHLVPQLGTKKLDEITTEDIQRLKHRLNAGRAPKTLNNIRRRLTN